MCQYDKKSGNCGECNIPLKLATPRAIVIAEEGSFCNRHCYNLFLEKKDGGCRKHDRRRKYIGCSPEIGNINGT